MLVSRRAGPRSMSLVDELRAQEAAWEARPLVRRLYHSWYELIVERLSAVEGPTIELGSGISRFKEHYPDAIASDVEPTPWTDRVVDAERLPFEDGSVANLVLIDVFHHLARPSRFLDSAVQALAPGGRLVILDPYCSPASYFAYRRFHHERTDLDVDAFADDEHAAAAPMQSNQARATLVFFRRLAEFRRRWPELTVVERRLLALLVYPLSGGFTKRPFLPTSLYGPLSAVERALLPILGRAGAFRCLVVVERQPVHGRSTPGPETISATSPSAGAIV
jgi:SAM-dependent methyltransferase